MHMAETPFHHEQHRYPDNYLLHKVRAHEDEGNNRDEPHNSDCDEYLRHNLAWR